jgi:hypothetical protein
MNTREIESWALRVIDRVEAHQPNEDSKVELKSDWPTDYSKAARRIAGHANAARGEPILWLIGVDETVGVQGANYGEFADWYNRIKSQFEGSFAPPVIDLNIPYKGKTIVALLFETERSPFVVKNPAHGSPGGGPVSLEVPWREATAIRSATRADLIRLLAPLQDVPGCESLGGRLLANTTEVPGNLYWFLELWLYLYPKSNERIVIPEHRCEVTFEVPGCAPKTHFLEVDFYVYPRSNMTEVNSGVQVEGAGPLAIHARRTTSLYPQSTADAQITATLLPAGAERPIIITDTFHPTPLEVEIFGNWTRNDPPDKFRERREQS